jgi:hypothetical protein
MGHDMLLMELRAASRDLRNGAGGVLAPLRPRAPATRPRRGRSERARRRRPGRAK